MHIEIHIFPDPFPIDSESWKSELMKLNRRIELHILQATMNSKAAALGKQAFLDGDGMIIATVDLRHS